MKQKELSKIIQFPQIKSKQNLYLLSIINLLLDIHERNLDLLKMKLITQTFTTLILGQLINKAPDLNNYQIFTKLFKLEQLQLDNPIII